MDLNPQPFNVIFSNDLINTTEAANMMEQQNAQEAVSSEPPATEPNTQQQAPVAAAPVEETLYEVKINGQTHKVPLSELTSGYSRQSDYTRKTSEIAEYRRQIDAEVQQYRQQIQEVQQFFSDPRVQQALAGLRAGQTDPNQPLTGAQAQQLFQSQAQQQQAAQEQRLQAMAQEIEVKTLAAQFSREIDSTIGQIKDKFPVLQDVDGFELVLRQKVAERQPQSLDEAKRMFTEIASSVAQRLESRFQTQQKQVAADKAKLVTGGIEPPGGANVPMPVAPKLKIGQAELVNAAIADMMGTSQK